jgi:transketolase
LEQIKNDVCYSDNPVKLVGISAGVSYGALGSTHHSLHDFAVLRAINNITIVAPADNYETQEAIRAAANFDKPIYIRFGKKAMPINLNTDLTDVPTRINTDKISENPCFKESVSSVFHLGKGRTIREGSDLTFIATGEAVLPSFEAAEKLSKENGIECCVVSMHTIKPFDTELIAELAKNGKPIITVEEHSINGGLGEAVGSFLMQNGFRNKFKIVGLPDDHTVSGSQNEIFEHYGISENGLAKTAFKMISQ